MNCWRFNRFKSPPLSSPYIISPELSMFLCINGFNMEKLPKHWPFELGARYLGHNRRKLKITTAKKLILGLECEELHTFNCFWVITVCKPQTHVKSLIKRWHDRNTLYGLLLQIPLLSLSKCLLLTRQQSLL